MGSCLSSEHRGRVPARSSPAVSGRSLRRRHGSPEPPDPRAEKLHRIPGRAFLNGATRSASLFSQQGKKGTNQDAMVVWESFGSQTDTVFCGVFDGHGPHGHIIARRVRDYLPLKLSAHWDVNIDGEDCRESNISTQGSITLEESASLLLEEEEPGFIDLGDNKKHPEIFTALRKTFLKAFMVMDMELKLQPNIDCFCSGTTAVTLVKQGQDLIIGNVGDSRAILGTRDHNDCLAAVQLTVDLKPNLPREAERIKKCKGRVFALRDEPEVSRVWLPNNNSPGLAMARAFGDFCLKDFGLISVPEMSYRRLNERDEFVVLATDGIWDVLSNKEVVDIVASAPTRSTAARSIVESAVRVWRIKYPTSKVDDCAVVCLFLTSETSINASITSEQGSSETSNGKKEPIGTDGSYRSQNEADEWSALEGVARANTMLTLPRFVAGGKD